MITKIATIVTILTLALGGAGIVAASAMSDVAQGGTPTQTQTMTAAKYAGEEVLSQAQTRTATQTFARKGDLHQTPWAFLWGETEETGNPWLEEYTGEPGTVENATGFGFGGRGDLAPKGTIDD